MTLGALIYSAGISLFLDPNSLAPGGVSGISILLNRVTGVSTGAWILLLNIPILAVGAWKFGGRFILTTVYCTVLTSVGTDALTVFGAATEDPFLAAVAGSSLLAVGLGLVFRSGSTTGGMDIIVKLLRRRFPHLHTGSLVLALDLIVVALSALVFRQLDLALYAAIAVFITSVVLDFVLYGSDGAKLIYIISDRPRVIARRLLEELNIGATFVRGSGAYSGDEKEVILCVAHRQIAPKIEEIVKAEDPTVFMIISNAAEIYGEGYKNIFQEKV